ncbi:ABC transporter ATP-binding protein/permease [Alphaproteobacteria bacterium]|nr:ABC transporter ATP-binding protein/permease [Alphaproteobacteria bacterium]
MGFAHSTRMFIALTATIAACVFQLFIPRYVGDAVDYAQGLLLDTSNVAVDPQAALWSAAYMIILFSILRGLFTMLQNYHGEAIGHCIGYELRLAFYKNIQRLSFGFHDRVHTGDLITRGMLDLEGVRMFISTGIVRLVMLIVLIGGATLLMLKTDLLLTILALSFVPFVGWRSSLARLKLRWMWLLMQEKLGVLTRLMEENLTGIRVVRAFSGQKHELKLFEEASNNTLKVALERVSVRVGSTTVMSFSFFVAMGLVVWLGGLKVIEGEITVGRLAEFLAFMTILQMPVRQIGMLVNSFARASTCGARIFEVIDRQPNISDEQNAPSLKITSGVLKFDNVDFSFSSGIEAKNILSGINFTIAPGGTLGIVGPPGSGKSTIANLIPRFYDVSSGSITIDNQDIREISLESLRQFVSVVQQDSFLFTASIENNIAYGDPWSDGDRITVANTSAQLHDYVARLPLGYETLIGERGVSLSGGQRQRLSIARGIILKPGIIVFDDSTAAIDSGTEQKIRQALRKDTEERATIIVSHRLGSLMHADEILFVDKGKIIERGNHNALIEKRGRYYDLFRLQARSGSDQNDKKEVLVQNA